MSAPRWRPAYVALGSNLDDPRRHLEGAVDDLRRIAGTRLYRVSGVVRSAPMDGSDQPDYLNAVVALMTRLDPHALLAALQDIERCHGRRPGGPRWGARPLDLDLLACGDLAVNDETLRLPHPGLAERAFVVGPLAQIADELRLPGLGRVAALAARIDLAGLEDAGPLATRDR